ncbi:MAG: hypothetical protein OEY94_01390 [Alphaproteobacteria bacterium]|nr:hypothetical protein [Alphaproteobacteria bacterium]
MITFKKLICLFCLVFSLSACSSSYNYANSKLKAISEEEKEPITVLSFSPLRHETPVIDYELINDIDQDNSTVTVE